MNLILRKITVTNKIRLIEVFLGLVFFISGYSKLIEINKFTVQIYSYGVIGNKSLLPYIALIVILLELFLAVMLTFGVERRKLLHSFVLFLLLFFSGLILYGWIFHNIQDCGCFGKIEIGPGPSLIKNIILIGLTLLCLTGVNKMPSIVFNYFTFYIKFIVVFLVMLSGLIMGYSNLKTETNLLTSKNLSSPFQSLIEMKFEIEGKHYDLSKGEYLIALLSFGCDHCIEEAPKLNDYLMISNLPSLLAICLEELPEEKEDFILRVRPQFPLYSLGNKPLFFLSLIDKEPPRLIHVKDGKVLKIWDYNLPELNELADYFNSLDNS